MKKKMCLVLALVLLTGFAGCNRMNVAFSPTESQSVSLVDQLKPMESTTSSFASSKESVSSYTVSKVTSKAASKAAAKPAQTSGQLPLPSSPTEFWFSSGAGGWGTTLDLKSNGTFSGEYHDSDMGASGDGYPNGTRYIATFAGRFTNVTKINDYSYKMNISTLTYEETQEKWIENGILHIASDAYGLSGGREFVFYCPQTPIDVLTDEFVSWHPDRGDWDDGQTTLECYAIYNVTEGLAFFSSY